MADRIGTILWRQVTLMALVYIFAGRCTEVVVCKINPLAKVTEITLNASSSLSLDCVVVSSHPVQTIKWVKDERVLKIDTGTHRVSTLSLYNVTVEDVGTYCCIAGIGNREGSCEISVHINALPTIVHPVRMLLVATIGSILEIPCRAVGWPVPMVSWFRHGRKLVHDQQGLYVTNSKENEAKLTINRMLQIYQGIFTCMATNTLGQDSRLVRVIPKLRQHLLVNPKIKAISREVTSSLGSNASLRCQGIHAYREGQSYFYWVFKGNSSRQNPRWFTSMNYEYTAVVNISLLIVNVSAADIGTYMCFAELLHGVTCNASMYLRLESQVVTEDVLNNAKPSILYWMITAGVFAGSLLMGLVAYLLKKGNRSKFYDTFKEQTDVSKYDVFVSYCGRDFSWVQGNLLPLLDTYQLKYCIHTRDFEVGKPILHNMADSVFGSRVTVAVISSSYMTSKFCQEELSMAVCKSMAANRPSLLAIRIDSVSRKKLPKNLRRTTFLDYIDSTEQQTWDRRLIKHLLSHIETGKSRERKFKLDL